MSILFNEKYTEEDIHDLCVATIRKIKKILHTNRELEKSLLEDLASCKYSEPDYVCAMNKASFDRTFFAL